MSMTRKVYARSNDIRPEGDRAKKVYRSAIEAIRRLDEIAKLKKAYREVFMPDAINLRSRLQDYCEKLMFYDPLVYGRKAEELLWRKVYYEVIQLMKHNRKQMRPSSSLESAFRTHLMAASGYYHHLLYRLQAEYHLSMQGFIDIHYMADNRQDRRSHITRKEDVEPLVKDWAIQACHRCLVYLGDLARYQQDYDGARSRVLSQRYYFQALSLQPSLGMPHNQLGTLAGNRYYSLDAAYYYMRCLVTAVPFDSAHGNLMRLLEKNRHRFQDLNNTSTRDLPPEQQRWKDIKRLIIRFMHLMDILHSKNINTGSKLIQESCQNILRDFELCMFYQPPHVTQPSEEHDSYIIEERCSYIEDEMLLKITVICIMSIDLLGRDGNKKVTAAIAFSLALFSHILNHAMIRLQTALCELSNPRKVLCLDSADDKDLTSDVDSRNKSPNPRLTPDTADESRSKSSSSDHVPAKDGKQVDRRKDRVKKIRSLRRRKYASSSSQSPEHGAGSDSDLSEGDHVAELSVSDSDEDLQFLKRPDSSDTDSEDNLMVSQELRPGFSQCREQLTQSLNSVPEEAHEQSRPASSINLNSSFNSSLLSELERLNTSEQPLHLTPHVADYLPVNRTKSSSFIAETLNFSTHVGAVKGDEQSNAAELKAVAQGTREIRVPPGFERAEETQYVREITEKMTNYFIETDTDITQTDTDYSTVTTESEVETETEQDSNFNLNAARKHLDNTFSVISREGLLCSIKLYCDWLRCNPHIIATCAKSSQSLWSRLSVLLNFLPLEKDLKTLEVCRMAGLLRVVSEAESRDWVPTLPLPEDLHLQEFSPLQTVHCDLDYTSQNRVDVCRDRSAILRILCLRRFGYYISKMKSINFTYDSEKSMFLGPKQQLPLCTGEERVSTDPECQAGEERVSTDPDRQKEVDMEARRNQLMKDMAQLRLQAEVSQLEGTLQSHDQVNLPPYLVPDATVLCDNLTLLKQLANSARFIIIIPIVVIDHLDMLKKELCGARDCIRWLEAEIKKGNRYVRHQKPHEKMSTLPLKNLKKKDRETWRFVQIVDCAKYLSQQCTDCDPRGMVAILTQHTYTDASPRLTQTLVSAQNEGVSVQTAAEFHTRWKDIWQGAKT